MIFDFAVYGKMTEYEVEKILDVRKRKSGQQYLVRWKNYGPEDDTWETVRNLKSCIDLVEEFHASSILSNEDETQSSVATPEVIEFSTVGLLSRNAIAQQEKPNMKILSKETLTTRQENMVIDSEGTSSLVDHAVDRKLQHLDNYLSASKLSSFRSYHEGEFDSIDDDDDDDPEILFPAKVKEAKNWAEKMGRTSSREYSHFKEYYVTECLKHMWILIILYVLTFAAMLWFTDLLPWKSIFEADTNTTLPQSSNLSQKEL